MFLRDEKASKDQRTLLIALDLIKATLIFDLNKSKTNIGLNMI